MGEGKQISRLENPQPSDARQKYIYIFFYFYFLFNVFVFLNFKFLNRISLFFLGGGGVSRRSIRKRGNYLAIIIILKGLYWLMFIVGIFCFRSFFMQLELTHRMIPYAQSRTVSRSFITFGFSFLFVFLFFQGGYLLLLLSLVLFQHLCSCYFSINFKFEVLIFFFLLLLSVSIPLLSLSIFSLHL